MGFKVEKFEDKSVLFQNAVKVVISPTVTRAPQ